VRKNFGNKFHITKRSEKLSISTFLRKNVFREVKLKEYSVVISRISGLICGRGLPVIICYALMFAISAYRQPIPGFPLTLYAKLL
jgi:hypothetical protein